MDEETQKLAEVTIGDPVSLSTAKNEEHDPGFETESESEDEGYRDYRRGGYFPVKLGSIFKQQYKVISKLGWGNFSTVWKVIDLKNPGKQYALKIVKSDPDCSDVAEDEIKMLETITKNDPNSKSCCCRLIDHFKSSSVNGVHICMVFEILGSTLLSLIRLYRYQGIPIDLVKVITKQVLIALDYLNTQCQLIHTDLKPENVLLFKRINKLYDSPYNVTIPKWNSTPPLQIIYCNIGKPQIKVNPRKKKTNEKANEQHKNEVPQKLPNFLQKSLEPPLSEPIRKKGLTVEDCRINLCDFGNATWIRKHFTDDVQTRQYRSPEVILERKWNEKIDIWSLACMVFELLTGEQLFRPKEGENHTKEQDHVARFIELLGPFPRYFLRESKRANEFFTRNGEFKIFRQDEMKPLNLHDTFLEYGFGEQETKEMTSFLLPMLEYDDSKRASARKMLEHPWLNDVKLPDEMKEDKSAQEKNEDVEMNESKLS